MQNRGTLEIGDMHALIYWRIKSPLYSIYAPLLEKTSKIKTLLFQHSYHLWSQLEDSYLDYCHVYNRQARMYSWNIKVNDVRILITLL